MQEKISISGIDGISMIVGAIHESPETLTVPLIVVVKFRGSIAAVEAAMDAAEAAANSVSGVVARHIIPRPEHDTQKMLTITGFDKPQKKK